MSEETFFFKYQKFNAKEELSSEDVELITAAEDALRSSYAPYSKYNVGAAVRLDDGTIVKGSNQENIAFPSGLCAERTALFAASATYPDRAIVSIAVLGGPDGIVTDQPTAPCGACRQVMIEMEAKGGKRMTVILAGAKSILKFNDASDLLPFIFNALI